MAHAAEHDLTLLLKQWSNGDLPNEDELVKLIYPLLYQAAQRQLSKENNNLTLQTTEIVNEAYIKLKKDHNIDWQNRQHFRAISANIIRRIVVDNFRLKNRIKRGGLEHHVTFDRIGHAVADDKQENFDWITLHEQLNHLKELDEDCAKIVELRYFGGFTVEEAAEACKISVSSAVRSWRFARGWLQKKLQA